MCDVFLCFMFYFVVVLDGSCRRICSLNNDLAASLASNYSTLQHVDSNSDRLYAHESCILQWPRVERHLPKRLEPQARRGVSLLSQEILTFSDLPFYR